MNGQPNNFEIKFEAIRRRLVAIRKFVTEDNQSEFARILNMHPNRWSNIERGSPLTLRVAMLLCSRVDGLSIDYVIDGNMTRLPLRMRRQLSKLEGSSNSEKVTP